MGNKTKLKIGTRKRSNKQRMQLRLAGMKSIARKRAAMVWNVQPQTEANGQLLGLQIKCEFGDEPQCKIELKEELQEQEDCNENDHDTEMEVDVGAYIPGHFLLAEPEPGPSIIHTDPLLPTGGEIKVCSLLPGKRCLICFRDDPYSPPLEGILPKVKKAKGVRHPEQVEDDMRIIYLLKMIFQWGTQELNYLMELSLGQSPREWIHVCQSCRVFVFEIQTLEDRMRVCRQRIKNMIVKSTEKFEDPFSHVNVNMTGKIRDLVEQQVLSAKASGAFMKDGDWLAKKQIYNEIQKNKPKPKPKTPRPRQDYLHVVPNEISNHKQIDMLSPEGGESSDGDERANFPKMDFSNPLIKEIFTCPYGCFQDNLNSGQRKMSIAEMVKHLIYHSDYPMNCSSCKIFLPRDPSVMDAHWQQYHSDIETPSEKRFLEKQIYLDLNPPTESDNDEGPPGPPMKCLDCTDDSTLLFTDMHKLKIHQALEHPQVARVSCPFCHKKFQVGTPEVMRKHMRMHHNVGAINGCLKSKPCKYCGEMLACNPDSVTWSLRDNFKKVESIHVISKHSDLIKATYTCTLCSVEFSDLKEFVKHSEIHPEVKVGLNIDAVNLSVPSFKRFFFNCGLCPKDGSEEASKLFQSVNSLSCHLTLAHCLYLKWKFAPLDPSIKTDMQWKSIEEHIEDMKGFQEHCNKVGKNATAHHVNRRRVNVNVNVSSSSWKRETVNVNRDLPTRESESIHLKGKPLSNYTCPSCPQLEEMDVDVFIVHLLFHWKHPNRCPSCKLYLPFSTGIIDEHWKHHHPDLCSSTVAKFEPAPFSPGNIFQCQNCPEKFASFKNRNEHELTHSQGLLPKPETCNICNERFPNRNEVRLHKALDHPEIASLSCFYCEEIFQAESLEGVQYLDSEALQQHIWQKDDHPKSNRALMFLKACDLCGEVFTGTFRSHDHIRSHIRKVHGVATGRINLQCFICNKGVANLWVHLNAAHAKNAICDTCGEEMRPRGLPVHKLCKHDVLMDGFTRLECKEEGCDYKTVYALSFKHHVTVNHSKNRERTHKCSFCEKAFFDSGKLKDHEERHRNKDIRPYQCEICGTSYAARNDLYIHNRLTHLNQKFPSTNRKRTKPKLNEATLRKQLCQRKEVIASTSSRQ